MDPPSKASFPTRSKLVDTAQSYAMAHRYVVTIKQSCNRNSIVVLGCDRSGQYHPRNGITDETKICNTSTKLLDCPFEIRSNLKNSN
jgi:hypothetical protein